MRRILTAVVVAAVLIAGCGGDDDDNGGEFGTAADPGGEQTESGDDSSGDDASGGDGSNQPAPITDDPDGAVAGFPIPSPPGAVDGIATEVDGVQAAQVWYDASRWDEVIDHYEDWFIDNGLIETRPDRSLGQVVIGGENDTGGYVAIIIRDDDRVFVQLSVE